jgi:5-hydroxyisourate hydrolase-like protein (transthyretin family)
MSNNIRIFRHGLVVLILTTLISMPILAQNITSTLELKELKTSDDSRIFNMKLTGESEEGKVPVYQAKIDLLSVAEGKSEVIATATTDRDGKATFTLKNSTSLLRDKEGVAEVKTVFKGTGKLAGAEASVKFKELNLKMALIEKDSLNTIVLKASSVGPKGETIPVKETNFNLYVQGLYSKLKVGECFVDAGEGTFTFPGNIPGDENGNLKIYVRLEDNEAFGEVEKTENAKWGNHRTGFVEPQRSLWTSGAPIWMITTLIILLAGVWSHYMYAIIQMIKIRKEGKKLEES